LLFYSALDTQKERDVLQRRLHYMNKAKSDIRGKGQEFFINIYIKCIQVIYQQCVEQLKKLIQK
jgi:hypothetical protein